jgi:RNA polymerase primary sigma factor
MSEKIAKMYRIRNEYLQQNGIEPDNAQLAEALGVSEKKVESMMKFAAQEPLSLEMPVGNDGSELGEFIPDVDTATPQDEAQQNALRKKLESIVDQLRPKEKIVITLRFGLYNNHPHTLEEVGKKLGVTRERIRQIEARALSRLRRPLHSRELREYLPPDKSER